MNNQKIKYHKLSLSREEINKLNPLFRKRYIMLTSIMRDATLLSKLIHYTRNSDYTKIELKYANTMASLFFLTTFISKGYEMWAFITRNKILEELNNQSNSIELQKSVDDINKFFSDTRKKGIFEFIRHKFSCHYEYENDIDVIINDAFGRFQGKDFQMYLSSTDSANDIFPSLNSVILICIFKQMDDLGFSGSDEDKMKTLFLLTGEVAKLIMNFCPLYLTEIFPVKWNLEEEMEIDVPEISTVKLPVIVIKRDDKA